MGESAGWFLLGGVSDMGLLLGVWILERSQLWMTLDGNCEDCPMEVSPIRGRWIMNLN